MDKSLFMGLSALFLVGTAYAETPVTSNLAETTTQVEMARNSCYGHHTLLGEHGKRKIPTCTDAPLNGTHLENYCSKQKGFEYRSGKPCPTENAVGSCDHGKFRKVHYVVVGEKTDSLSQEKRENMKRYCEKTNPKTLNKPESEGGIYPPPQWSDLNLP